MTQKVCLTAKNTPPRTNQHDAIPIAFSLASYIKHAIYTYNQNLGLFIKAFHLKLPFQLL